MDGRELHRSTALATEHASFSFSGLKTAAIWSTALATEHASPFDNGRTLDAISDVCYYTVKGGAEKHALSAGGNGVNPAAATEDSVTLCAGFNLEDNFPASGLVTITQGIRFLDCRVDPMSNIGTAALPAHSFTFDAGSGAAAAETVRVSTPLSGGYGMTLLDNPIRNERVRPGGVVPDAAIDYRSAGLYVSLSVRREGWTDAHINALLYPAHPDDMRGLRAVCTADGEPYTPGSPSSIPSGGMTILPVFPSDYADARPLTMTLALDRWTSLNGEPLGEDRSAASIPGPWAAAGESQPPATFEIPLP